MLSRIAESLYWIGRYVERAEDTARILDVHMHRMLADPGVDEETACRSLLTVMGMTAESNPTSHRVAELLGLDPGSASSVGGALAAARASARGAREIISTDLWECLNSTWHTLPEARRRVEHTGVHAYLRWVRERCAVLAGLTDATMSRDESWHFLVLGRSLERVDMTSRLLSTHTGAGGSIPSWLTLLRSCGAWETFLRTYRGALDDRHAAEFLLLDRLFPRSVFAALVAAENCLTSLEPGSGRAGVTTRAVRIVGRARTELEFQSVDELLEELPPTLARLQRACSAVNEAVTNRYFRQTRAVAWSGELVA